MAGAKIGAVRFLREADDDQLLALIRVIHEEKSIEKLRLTGGEPLMYPRLCELLARLRVLLPSARLCLTTNGALLAQKAGDLKVAGLDALNVSLDTLDAASFRDLTGGGRLESTIAGICAARNAGFANLKLNAVLVRSVNAGQLDRLVRFAADANAEIRFIELMPYGQGAALFTAEYFAADEALAQLLREFPHAGPLAPSATAKRYRFVVDGRPTVVGFIASVSHPFCASCNRLRLSRGGGLFACLRQKKGADLLTPLQVGDTVEVRQRIRSAIQCKHDHGGYWPDHNMVSIGG